MQVVSFNVKVKSLIPIKSHPAMFTKMMFVCCCQGGLFFFLFDYLFQKYFSFFSIIIREFPFEVFHWATYVLPNSRWNTNYWRALWADWHSVGALHHTRNWVRTDTNDLFVCGAGGVKAGGDNSGRVRCVVCLIPGWHLSRFTVWPHLASREPPWHPYYPVPRDSVPTLFSSSSVSGGTDWHADRRGALAHLPK